MMGKRPRLAALASVSCHDAPHSHWTSPGSANTRNSPPQSSPTRRHREGPISLPFGLFARARNPKANTPLPDPPAS